MRKQEPTRFKNFIVKQLSDGTWLAEVDILSPKAYRLQYSHEDKETATNEIVKYLESQDATEETD